MTKQIKLIYVMDPHCGWCFGFGKVITELFEKYKNNLSVQFDVKPGGLFYPSIKISKGFADDKRPIAMRIEELSGVKFSEEYFTKILGERSILDSEPPSRAILCVMEINNEKVIPFTEKLLEKEFIYGKNNSLNKIIFETTSELDIDKSIFEELYKSEKLRYKVSKVFQETRNMASDFPTLFLNHNNHLSKLASGYAPIERLIKKIEMHL